MSANSIGKTISVAGNDNAAIQQAIDRAAAGDTVLAPKGEYLLGETVHLRSDILLVGERSPNGDPATILRCVSTHPMALLEFRACQETELADFVLDGADNSAAAQGIIGSDSRRIWIHRLAFRNFPKGNGGTHGVQFNGDNHFEHGVTDSAIDDCTFDRIGVGAAFGCAIRMSWGSSRNRVSGNRIRETGRGGIFGNDGSTDLLITHNQVSGSHGEGLGIEVWNGCDRAVVEDNHIDHWLSVSGSSNCALRRNIVGGADARLDVKFIGLELVAAADCIFTNNLVDGGQHIGISESNAPPKQYVYWGYNKISGCPGWGAQLQGETDGVIRQYFYRCEFSDMVAGHGPYPKDDGYGVRFNGNVHDVVFDQCLISHNARLGLQIGGENIERILFNRCAFIGNGGAAVSDSDSHRQIQWIDCAAKDNASDVLPADQPLRSLAPVAHFSYPAEIRAGAATTFRDDSAGASDHELWDFDDGPGVSGVNPVRRFSKPGRFRITLLIWNNAGRSAMAEKWIDVR